MARWRPGLRIQVKGDTIRDNAAAPAMLAVSGLDLLRDLPKLIYPGRGPSTTRGWKLLLDIVQLAGHLGQFVPKAKRGAAPYDLVELVLDACELLANPAQIDQ
jgi:hypothetical protein